MAKKFTGYRGKSLEELQVLSLKEFATLIPSRQRRSLLRGFTEQQKVLLREIDSFKTGKRKKPVHTHCRDMVILPLMSGMTIHVHSGKSYEAVRVTEEMIGGYLGEYVATRNLVKHSAPGIGATRSSASASVK